MGNAVKIILIFICNIALTIYAGCALSVVWGWFVCDKFGVEPLAIPDAIGLLIVVGFLTHQLQSPDKEKTQGELAYDMLIASFSKSTMALVAGFVVLQFI